MRSPIWLIIIMTAITLVSCIPTTNTVNPSLEESPHPLNTATFEPTSDIDIQPETNDLNLVTTVDPRAPQVKPGQSSPREGEEAPVPPISSEEISTMAPNNIDEQSANKLPQVQMAKEDLSNRLNISTDSIEIIAVELVIWPDNGMGCPQPGMAYKQVPVDGVLIRFSVEGVEYNYHSGGSKDPFLCETSPRIKSTPVGLNIEGDITPASSSIDK